MDRHAVSGGEKKQIKEQTKAYTSLLTIMKSLNVVESDMHAVLLMLEPYLSQVRDLFPGPLTVIQTEQGEQGDGFDTPFEMKEKRRPH